MRRKTHAEQHRIHQFLIGPPDILAILSVCLEYDHRILRRLKSSALFEWDNFTSLCEKEVTHFPCMMLPFCLIGKQILQRFHLKFGPLTRLRYPFLFTITNIFSRAGFSIAISQQ